MWAGTASPIIIPICKTCGDFGIEIGYTTDTGSTIDAFENATWFATYIGNGGASDGSDGGVANGTFESFSVTGFAPSSIPAGDVLIIDFFALEGTKRQPATPTESALFDDARLNALPEPSTWAMMLLGFGGLGYAACRRARASKAASAQDCAGTDVRAPAGSQRHFSLGKVLRWAQPQPRQGCHLANVG